MDKWAETEVPSFLVTRSISGGTVADKASVNRRRKLYLSSVDSGVESHGSRF
jgi:hypothetical protein